MAALRRALRPQPARPADRRELRAALRAFSGPEPDLRSARGHRQAFPRFRARRAPEVEPYLPGLRPPLEAQLIDLADEVAYNTADLDDAFSAGMLTAEDVAACVPQYRRDPREPSRRSFPARRPRAIPREPAAVDRCAGLRADRRHRRSARGKRASTNADDVRAFPGRLAAFTPEAARDQPGAEALPVSEGVRLAGAGRGPAAGPWP